MTRSTRPDVASSLPVPRRDRLATRGYHRHLMTVRIALFATLWIVAGCTSAASSGSPSGSPGVAAPSTDIAGSLEPASQQPLPVSTASPGPSDLPTSVVEPVVADIARLAAVPVDQVTVQSAEWVTFPDGGLGCPVAGMVYTQVLVDGYKIVAVGAGTTYDYRGTGPGKFRLCTPLK
jgi:hypothetical protein